MRIRKPVDEPFEIMLIPMIDCMLVIIIFFLVATTMKHATPPPPPPPTPQERELPLTLPESDAALRVESPPDLFIIGVNGGGQLYATDHGRLAQVTLEGLHTLIREAALANPAQHVRIDADRSTRFDEIVHLLDLCEFEGLHNVGLHTNPGNN